ncbi:MAG: hypothetical protein OXC01_03920 [Immundisolibacterales bacterium]|nr:hypothetical protein [Immundisolibacterales bacterium]
MCLLRVAPQDLPASSLLLALAIAAHAGLGTVVSLLYVPFSTALGVSVTGTVLLGVLAYALLSFRGLVARFSQTYAALAGTGAVLEAVALPIVAVLDGTSSSDAPSATGVLRTVPWLALLVWSWVVSGHILRHALSVHITAGIGISMAFFWLSAVVIHRVFGSF